MKLWLVAVAVLSVWIARDITSAVAQEPDRSVALKGTVIAPSGVLADGVVVVDAGRIKSVGITASVAAIEIDSVIVPGLIDLHNHYTWNVFPRWSPPVRYANRYEWQEDPAYHTALRGPHGALIAANYGCEMNRYAEIKAIVNGATAGVGGFDQNGCVTGLLRNLDLDSEIPGIGGLNRERLRNLVFPFELNLKETPEDLVRGVDPASPDGSATLRAVVMHVGEGVDASSRRELRVLRFHGFVKKGVSITHGVGFTAAEFVELGAAGAGLVWSPRSNLALYGRTTDVVSANASGVKLIAVAPDWSPTGSAGMLDELATAWKLNLYSFARKFTEHEMFKMATSNPATMAGLPGRIGSLEPGAMGDLLALRKHPPNAHQSVLRSTAADVLLVVIGGQAIYGEAALMARVAPVAQLEYITVCGEAKALNVSNGVPAQSFGTLKTRLESALKSVGSVLAPLAEC